MSDSARGVFDSILSCSCCFFDAVECTGGSRLNDSLSPITEYLYTYIYVCIQLNKLERVYYYVMWMEIRSLVMSEKIEYCQIGISSDRLSRVGSLSYRNIVSYLSEEHTLRNIDKMIKDAKAKMAKGDKKGKTALLFVIRNIYLSLLTLNHFCCRCPLCYEA